VSEPVPVKSIAFYFLIPTSVFMNKILFDFFPIVLFFIAYKNYDLYVATAVVIAATIEI
jgi:hypothetical protein